MIDRGPAGALLVEPNLEGLSQARALAADYRAVAEDLGGPQTRRVWRPDRLAATGRVSSPPGGEELDR